MALSFKLSGNVLEVKETSMGWNSTTVAFWYYDVEKWLVSSHGRQNEAPSRPMVQGSIDWVQKYYLPKVQGVVA